MNKKSVLLTALAIAGFAVTSLAQTVPAYVPTNGLVGWWPFNGNAIDESVNTNDGTVNGATLTTDRFGNANSAYSFDGTSNFIEIPDSPPLRLNNTDFTISFWVDVNTFGNGSNATAFLFKRGSGSNNGWIIDANSGDSYSLEYQVSSGTNPNVSSNTIISTNVWHNLIVRYSLATQNIAFYYDGVLDGSPSSILPTPNSSCSSVLRFGYDTYPPNPYWLNGNLDDIGIWNRALTQQEITDLYNACSVTSIVSQPTNQTLASGSNAVFTVSATAGSPLQWQTNLGLGFQNLSNAGQYSGVTTQTLTVSSIGVNNNNQTFRCIVGSGSCSDTSNVATLSLSTVGVEDLSLLKNVELYPNPATAELHIKSVLKFSSIKIINNVGQVVLNKDAANAIDVSSLSKGIYFVNLINALGVTIETRKIVLQ